MKKIRWGLVSTANINRKVIPAIRASHRGSLAAVASRNLHNARAYAKQWEIPLAYGSYQEMLDSGKVDAVYISLPNHLHAEWSIRALRAGVHVLCEKPFAISLEDVDAMIAASRETGRVLAEAFMYLHHPQTKIVGEWVRSGRLGEITLVQGAFNYKIKDRNDLRLAADCGGGSLWDVGVYPMSMAQYVYGGPPARVQGIQWLGDTLVDESFVGQMVFRNGSHAQIASSFRTPFHTEITIEGTLGRIRMSRPFTYLHDPKRRLTFYPAEPADGEPFEIDVPNVELYIGEIEDMHSAIQDGKPQYLSLEQTRDHVRTALALYEAARTGQAVELDQPRFR